MSFNDDTKSAEDIFPPKKSGWPTDDPDEKVRLTMSYDELESLVAEQAVRIVELLKQRGILPTGFPHVDVLVPDVMTCAGRRGDGGRLLLILAPAGGTTPPGYEDLARVETELPPGVAHFTISAKEDG